MAINQCSRFPRDVSLSGLLTLSDSQGRDQALAVLADPDRVYVMVCIILLWFRVRLRSGGDQPQRLGELQVFLATCKPAPLTLVSTFWHTEIRIVMGGRGRGHPSLR